MDNNDIDIVVTWVDGSDPAWLAEREKYAENKANRNPTRYRDWGLMRYWFRSVERFAPWVRKIHFVTWGHLPDWLDVSNPKLHIVRHSDFIPAEYLPTFNSHTIELNLHRIEGLAERFLYLNDDCFINRPVSPEFFFRGGLPCDTFALRVIHFFTRSNAMIYANNLRVINDHFSAREAFRHNWRRFLNPANGLKRTCRTLILYGLYPGFFTGFFHWHVTFAFLKSTFNSVWEKAFDDLDATCRCRFRQSTNVGPTLLEDWQLVQGRFVPRRTKDGQVFQLVDANVDEACAAIRKQRYAVVCVNDTSVLKDVEGASAKVRSAFQSLLPEKSSFEL